MRKIIEAIVLLWLSYFIYQHPAHAFTEDQAVRAVMGESRGEPYIGKLAVSEAIRRRGTLSGVYGANVPLATLRLEKSAIWADALRAWRQSKTTNIVPNCKYWFSKADLNKLNMHKPRWFKRLHFVKQIGASYFYAESTD